MQAYLKMDRKQYLKEYRRNNKEKIALTRRAYEKKWRQKPDVKLKKKRYMKEYRQRESSKENKKIQDKKYASLHRKNLNKYLLNYYYETKEKFPLIIYARGIAQKVPLKESCEWCGSTKLLQRHHEDYDKPLEIITLCSDCHGKTRKNKSIPLLN